MSTPAPSSTSFVITAGGDADVQFDVRRAHLPGEQRASTFPDGVAGGGVDGAAASGPNNHDNNANANNANSGNANQQPNAGNADIFVQIPEARQLVDALVRYLPYVFILAFKYMIDHMDGILNVVLLVIMFSHANWQVKKQISRQKQRSLFALLRELVYVSVVLLFVGLMVNDWSWSWLEWFEATAISEPERDPTTEWPLRRLLYNVLMTDLVAKLVTVHAKIMVTLLPPCVVNYRNRVGVLHVGACVRVWQRWGYNVCVCV